MRAHPVFVSFDRRWQLPVYFQLRWKEIVTKLEEVLAVTKLERNPTKGVPSIIPRICAGHSCWFCVCLVAYAPFVTAQGAAVWEAITSCWSAQVYIPDLAHRFWKFNLQVSIETVSCSVCPPDSGVFQLLSRYKTWLDASLPAIDTSSRLGNLTADRLVRPFL